jgi:hypothetical protein
MAPAARYAWIERYLRAGARNGLSLSVDVLNQPFVEAYLAATGALYSPTMFGAHKCPQLGRDLGVMATRLGRLRRGRIGVNGGAGEGFPAWVYTYAPPEA